MTDTNDSSKADDKGKAPEFDGEFDAERAKRLVANLRSDLDKARADLKTATDAITSREDAEKSELQKALDRVKALEDENKSVKTEALRTRIAAKHELPEDLVGFLSGDTEEELETKAKSLASYAKKEPKDEGKDPVTGKPKTRLVPGHQTEEGAPAFDPRAVADRIRETQ